MKITEPELQPELESFDDLWELLAEQPQDEAYLVGIHLRDVTVSHQTIPGVDFNGMVLENCKLLYCNLEKCSFVDVVFQNCDFSNSQLCDCYFSRCRFVNCKWMGADMYNGSLRQVLAENCNFSYVNLDNAGLNHVSVAGSDFSHANMSNCRLKEFAVHDSRFAGVNFFGTPLAGLDFSKSDISGIVTSDSHSELRGALVSATQAVELARLLGIKVK